MKKKMLLMAILACLFFSIGLSQQNIRANYSEWYTVYNNGSPKIKVQISFSVTNCNQNGNINGLSYWRINNIWALPKAHVKFYFDYLSCDGKIGKQRVKVNLAEVGIDAYQGNLFMGYQVVKYPYDIVVENYNNSKNSDEEIDNMLSASKQRTNELIDKSQKLNTPPPNNTINRSDRGLESGDGMGRRAETTYPKPEVLASTANQQVQVQTQDYIDKANSASDPIQRELNIQFAKINSLKQGGNNQQQLNEIAVLEKKQAQENTEILISGLSSLFKLFTKSENKSASKSPKITDTDKALEYYNAGYYKESIELYKKAAGKGNTTAMINLGFMYEKGKGLPQDYTEALQWFTKAANAGNSEAMCKIGEYYEEGKGVNENIELAIEWYKKAADLKNPDAYFNIAYLYYVGEKVPLNEEKAFYWFKKAAELDEPIAEYAVGEMYLNGNGVEKNITQAIYWIRKSAENGYSVAMHDLAWIYGTGTGVDVDYNIAFEWFSKGAESGHSVSLYKLGMMYEAGLGTNKNEIMAFEKINKAADKNYLPAITQLAKMHLDGIGTTKNYARALSLFMKASELDDAEAMDYVGNIYAKGLGVTLDYTIAFDWFKKSAEKGFAEAMFDLALMYEHGYGVTKNLNEAIKWYKKAVENGSKIAEINLAKIEKK